MNAFNFRRALWTIVIAVCFSITALGISKAFPRMGPAGVFGLFPFMFGIAIPLANWNNIGILKLPKTVLAGVVSTGLLYITGWFISTEFNMYLISGLNGLLLLWVYSQLIENIKPTFINYLVVLVACLLAIYLSLQNADSNLAPDFYFTVLLWASFFTVGLTSALRTEESSYENGDRRLRVSSRDERLSS